MFQIHFFSCITSNICKANNLHEIFLIFKTVSNRQRNLNYYCQSRYRNNGIDFEIYCQCHSEKIRFENCHQDKGNDIRIKWNECYHEQSFSDKSRKPKKSKAYENQLKGRKANDVDKFTKLIIEGPVNKCIISNHCLHVRSVLCFYQDKYYIDMDKVLCNFTQQEHICRTYDHYLKKKKIPP